MSNKESMGKHTAAFHATVPLVYKIKPYAFKLALKTVQETHFTVDIWLKV